MTLGFFHIVYFECAHRRSEAPTFPGIIACEKFVTGLSRELLAPGNGFLVEWIEVLKVNTKVHVSRGKIKV